jgi:hypothetical protein
MIFIMQTELKKEQALMTGQSEASRVGQVLNEATIRPPSTG